MTLRIGLRDLRACLSLGILAAAAPAAAFASDHDWRVVSDVGQASLVALALGVTAAERDGDGARELAYSLGSTEAVTYGLKHTIHEERPNGRDDHSFPSGHTSTSFAAAAYLQQRYGWGVGLPATLGAAVVGLARVEAHEHHWYDVVAGAALGEASAVIFTKPRESGRMVTPWANGHGAGVTFVARF